MILLVSGATKDVRRNPDVGVLVRPGSGVVENLLRSRLWAADNAAFTGFDAKAFVGMLERIRAIPGCQFVACPDVVGEADKTLRLFRLWAPMVAALGFPVALVAQDGMTARDCPWGEFDALFIGGTTEFKMSREAESLLGVAAAKGIWRHVGRVNSRRRIRHFIGLCDSIDGSGFSKYGKRIARGLRWVEGAKRQPKFEACS